MRETKHSALSTDLPQGLCIVSSSLLFKRLCRQGDFEELDEGRQDQIKPLAHWCGPQQVIRNHAQGG